MAGIILNNFDNNYVFKDLTFYFLFIIISTLLLLLFILTLNQILGINLSYKVKISSDLLIIYPYVSSRLEDIVIRIDKERILEIEDTKKSTKILLHQLKYYSKEELDKISNYLLNMDDLINKETMIKVQNENIIFEKISSGLQLIVENIGLDKVMEEIVKNLNEDEKEKLKKLLV